MKKIVGVVLGLVLAAGFLAPSASASPRFCELIQAAQAAMPEYSMYPKTKAGSAEYDRDYRSAARAWRLVAISARGDGYASVAAGVTAFTTAWAKPAAARKAQYTAIVTGNSAAKSACGFGFI